VEHDRVNGDEEEWINFKAEDALFVGLIAVFALLFAFHAPASTSMSNIEGAPRHLGASESNLISCSQHSVSCRLINIRLTSVASHRLTRALRI
jgi:hypothetical protein